MDKNDINILNKKLKVQSIQGDLDYESSWKEYCEKTSIHGMQYLVDKDFCHWERGIWITILFAIIFMLSFAVITLDFQYKPNNMVTTVQSYSVGSVPFPAISICPNYEFDWEKFAYIAEKYLPDDILSNKTQVKIFSNFISKLENFHLGTFEKFKEFSDFDLEFMKQIDLKELLNDLLLDCDDVFEKCSIEGIINDCCKIFVPQVSKYGFCYSFNSVVNDFGKKVAELNPESYPIKSKYYGQQNGIKVSLKTNKKKLRRYHNNDKDKVTLGFYVSIHHPNDWSGHKNFIPINSIFTASIAPEVFDFTEQVKKLPTSNRPIIYSDETNDPLYKKLPDLIYSWPNCMGQCYQEFLLDNCNCSLAFLFPTGNYPVCSALHFKCLANLEAFNFENRKQRFDNENSHDDHIYLEHQLDCLCLKNVTTINYNVNSENIVPIIGQESLSRNENEVVTLLNIYFQRDNILKFTTTLDRSWFDYITYYGGLASFFLGISVTSCFEFIYFIMIRIFFKKKRTERILWENYERRKSIMKNINYNLGVMRKSRDLNPIDSFNLEHHEKY